MGIRKLVKQIIGKTGYSLVHLPDTDELYDRDGLISVIITISWQIRRSK